MNHVLVGLLWHKKPPGGRTGEMCKMGCEVVDLAQRLKDIQLNFGLNLCKKLYNKFCQIAEN
jgi:hypothetical protein